MQERLVITAEVLNIRRKDRDVSSGRRYLSPLTLTPLSASLCPSSRQPRHLFNRRHKGAISAGYNFGYCESAIFLCDIYETGRKAILSWLRTVQEAAAKVRRAKTSLRTMFEGWSCLRI